MTIAKLNLFSVASASGLIENARNFFASKAVSEEPIRAPRQQMLQIEEPTDQSRYARLLQNELDREHLTAVEREDTEMLDRVRAALYQD